MSIIDEYHKQIESAQYTQDPEQYAIVEKLAELQQELEQFQQRKSTLGFKIQRLLKNSTDTPKGCYIWGDVGRGKTWLMDMFFDQLDHSPQLRQCKIRLHFHHFMRAIHDQLSMIGEQVNPLKHIARSFAKRYQLLCLDEFHVSDITDAMLLYGLLEALFEENVILVATSNQPAIDLYKNGLQRERFLPAIKLIEQYTHSLNLNGPVDHRLRLLEKAETWYIGENDTAALNADLKRRFLEMTTTPAKQQQKLQINYRCINTIMLAGDLVWINFDSICGDQRGAADYIEIARQFHTVFISDIPKMNDSLNDKARRFINMIDEFYDRSVKLLISSAAQPQELYSGKQLDFEFKRTVSRLQEMRSHDYMQLPHKPV